MPFRKEEGITQERKVSTTARHSRKRCIMRAKEEKEDCTIKIGQKKGGKRAIAQTWGKEEKAKRARMERVEKGPKRRVKKKREVDPWGRRGKR